MKHTIMIGLAAAVVIAGTSAISASPQHMSKCRPLPSLDELAELSLEQLEKLEKECGAAGVPSAGGPHVATFRKSLRQSVAASERRPDRCRSNEKYVAGILVNSDKGLCLAKNIIAEAKRICAGYRSANWQECTCQDGDDIGPCGD
jgi:hypothetical protein